MSRDHIRAVLDTSFVFFATYFVYTQYCCCCCCCCCCCVYLGNEDNTQDHNSAERDAISIASCIHVEVTAEGQGDDHDSCQYDAAQVQSSHHFLGVIQDLDLSSSCTKRNSIYSL